MKTNRKGIKGKWVTAHDGYTEPRWVPDTPETDAQAFNAAAIAVNMPPNDHQFCHAAHARKLERERNTYRKALEHVISGWGGQLPDVDCTCEDCEFLRPIVEALRIGKSMGSV